MRAYQLPKGGAGIEALVQVERPDPQARASPGAGQGAEPARSISAISASCAAAIACRCARTSFRCRTAPARWSKSGPGVTRFKAGDRVAGNFFQRWPGGEPAADAHASALGGGIDGMLADYAMLEEDGVVKIPPHLSFEEGATLPCAGVTVWNAMMEHARLKAGDTMLLQGTGGVSIFGLQFAHAMGIRAIITSSSDDKLKRAKTLGAALGINYKTTPEWEKAAVEFTGGAASITSSKSAARRRCRARLAPFASAARSRMIGGLSGGATELNPGLIFSPPRQCAGHFRRLDADVYGNEPRDRSQRDQARDRQGVRLRRRASRLPAHGFGRAFRQDRHPAVTPPLPYAPTASATAEAGGNVRPMGRRAHLM